MILVETKTTFWVDVAKHPPKRHGLFYVLCGDGQQRRAWARLIRNQPPVWASEDGHAIPDEWKGILAYADKITEVTKKYIENDEGRRWIQ